MVRNDQEQENARLVDRREDVGGKLAWFLVALLITGFAATAWSAATRGGDKADKAIEIVNANGNRITKLEAQFDSINYRLDEIVSIIKSQRGIK